MMSAQTFKTLVLKNIFFNEKNELTMNLKSFISDQ